MPPSTTSKAICRAWQLHLLEALPRCTSSDVRGPDLYQLTHSLACPADMWADTSALHRNWPVLRSATLACCIRARTASGCPASAQALAVRLT